MEFSEMEELNVHNLFWKYHELIGNKLPKKGQIQVLNKFISVKKNSGVFNGFM